MNTEKITKTNHYENIINFLDAYFQGNDLPDTNLESEIAFCKGEIDALARKAEKAKEAAAKRKAETDALTGVVAGALTEEPQTIDEIVTAIGGEVTRAQVVSRLGKLAKGDEPVAEKVEVTIPGGEGMKARKIAAYKLA